jgi:NADPH-dependent curcumin reductase CurA
MPQASTNNINHRILLTARPRGLPTPQDFRQEETAVPTPGEGQLLLRTLYLSLDPGLRNLMDETGPVYAPSVRLGDVMDGGTVSRVVASKHPQFRAGDLVLGRAGWQAYSLSDGQGLTPLGDMAQPSLALGGLGMPAFTAYVGLLDIGQPRAGRNRGRGRSDRRRRRGGRADRQTQRRARGRHRRRCRQVPLRRGRTRLRRLP